MMKKKLFVFDIDGTLFDNNKHSIPKSTIEALEKLKEVAYTAIATGRSGFMLDDIKEINHLFNDYVLINGQYIEADGEVIYENPISKELLKKVSIEMDKMNLTYGFQSSNSEAVSNQGLRSLDSFTRLGLQIPPIDNEFYLNNNIYQAWVFCSETEARDLEKTNPEFQFIKWLDVGYDILPRSASKGQGVLFLAKHLKIDIQDIIVFGDGDNDIEMLEFAGLGIAMGNATENLKKVADYITDSIDNDGIYNALKYFKYIK